MNLGADTFYQAVAVVFVIAYLGVCVAAYVHATRWQDCAAKHGPDRCGDWGRLIEDDGPD